LIKGEVAMATDPQPQYLCLHAEIFCSNFQTRGSAQKTNINAPSRSNCHSLALRGVRTNLKQSQHCHTAGCSVTQQERKTTVSGTLIAGGFQLELLFRAISPE
jgi:hypothetical protein